MSQRLGRRVPVSRRRRIRADLDIGSHSAFLVRCCDCLYAFLFPRQILLNPLKIHPFSLPPEFRYFVDRVSLPLLVEYFADPCLGVVLYKTPGGKVGNVHFATLKALACILIRSRIE